MHTKYKPSRDRGRVPTARFGRLPLAVAIYFAIGTAAFAQDASQAPAQGTGASTPTDATTKKAKTLDTITVTAQKRVENPQKVPISLDVLGDQKLQQLDVKSFDDYVKYLPSVSYSDDGPSDAQIYMRGVANGSNGNHSGPMPSTGVYLDEEPITTIDGPLNLHIYDVSRVESLAGPQGTLYGASSESGTLRIITNKPDPKGFSASYSVEADAVDGGGIGHVEEGFVNIPFNDHSAIRLVAWDKHDAGYIDNVLATRTYPTWGGTISNGDCASTPTFICTGTAKNNYNVENTKGMRAEALFELGDNWTITPSVVTQKTNTTGDWSYDTALGFPKIAHFYPEDSTDNWTQAALTVQGKIGNFDVTYAFAHLNRGETADLDYTDYSFWYDTIAGYGASWVDNNGNPINPSQHIHSVDGFRKTSHELRIASPSDWRLTFVGGLFWEKQTHDIQQDYLIDGLASDISVPGWPNTIWLTEQLRTDKDEAVFGEATYKITDKLLLTGGIREFRVDDSLVGFYGFSSNYSSHEGVATCFGPAFRFAPCTDLDKDVKETNSVGKVNLSYQIDPNKMIYATWSQGFRPGGTNRALSFGPYTSDYLTNYEFGWKTTWMDNRLRWNGAVFDDTWKNFQFAVLGPNGLTYIVNANSAEIRGLETNLNFAATDNLQLSGGIALYDAKVTSDFCNEANPDGTPITDCPSGTNPGDGHAEPEAPKGTQLPITPKVKADLVARYNFTVDGMDAYLQAAGVYVGKRTSDLRLVTNRELGDMPAYATFDLSTGVRHGKWAVDVFLDNAFNSHGQTARFAECSEDVCANSAANTNPIYPYPPQYPNGQVYAVPIQPRTLGVRFTQDFN